MPHNPITLDLLKALDAIDQRGSFAAAAQALHKVPSALTYTIQKVELDLGIELFDRSGHRAVLTRAGKLILDEGRLILRDLDSLANSASKIASGWEPELTICVDTLFDPIHLFELIRRFNADHPYIKINLTQGSLSGTWEPLLNHSADLIISLSNSDPKLEGYDKRIIGKIQTQFMVNRDHPLLKNKDKLDEELIDKYPIIVVPDSSQILKRMTVGWTRQNKVITVPNMTEKILAQKAGLGVGHLPNHRVQAELETGELVALDLNTQRDNALIAWRKGTAGPGLQWILDHISGADVGLD